MGLVRSLIAGLAASCIATLVNAQTFPARPVTVVVAAAAGGPIDVFARLLAERMGDGLGQRIVIENIGGGGGTVGAARVAAAAPDGYTLLLGTVATHANPQLLSDKRAYDPATAFASVGLVAEIPLVLITRKDFPADTLPQFVQYSKSNSDKLNYGSAGIGSAAHLGCVMLDAAMGTKIQHVPYRGTALAMQDLQAGRLDFQCEIAVTAVQNIRAGTVKALATLSSTRTPVLPDLPSAAEAGLPGVNAYTWTALFAPNGTPDTVVAKINAAMTAAMDDSSLKQKLGDLGSVLVAPERRTPRALDGFVRDEIKKWGDATRAAGVSIE